MPDEYEKIEEESLISRELESAIGTIRSAAGDKLEKKINEFFREEPLDHKEIQKQVRKSCPEMEERCFVLSSQEQKARKKLTRQMQEKIRQIFHEEHDRSHRIKMRNLPELDRGVMDIMDKAGTQKEYDQLADTFYGTGREKKGELIINYMESLQREARKRNLDFDHLTPEQIARNFDFIAKANQFMEEIINICSKTDKEKKKNEKGEEIEVPVQRYGLSDAQKKQLLDYHEKNSDGALYAYSFGKAMLSPYYAYVRAEQMSSSEIQQMQSAELPDLEKTKEAAIEYMMYFANIQFSLSGINAMFEKEIAADLGEGMQEGVRWYDQYANPIELDTSGGYRNILDATLMKGEPLYAQLSDGSFKMYRNDAAEKDGQQFTVVDSQKAMPQFVSALEKELKKTDPWYIKSSQKFKDVQTALREFRESYQYLGDGREDEAQERMREHMEKLRDASENYLNWKKAQVKDKPNELESKRIKAIETLNHLAKENLDKVKQADFDKVSKNKNASVQDTINYFLTKIGSEKNIQMLNLELHTENLLERNRDLMERHGDLGPQGKKDAGDVMAHAIASAMVLQGRKKNNPLAEEVLNKLGREKMVELVKKTPVFQKRYQDLDREKFRDFMTKNGFQRVAYTIYQNMDAKQKKELAAKETDKVTVRESQNETNHEPVSNQNQVEEQQKEQEKSVLG